MLSRVSFRDHLVMLDFPSESQVFPVRSAKDRKLRATDLSFLLSFCISSSAPFCNWRRRSLLLFSTIEPAFFDLTRNACFD